MRIKAKLSKNEQQEQFLSAGTRKFVTKIIAEDENGMPSKCFKQELHSDLYSSVLISHLS